jgi:hypothetical protein
LFEQEEQGEEDTHCGGDAVVVVVAVVCNKIRMQPSQNGMGLMLDA